MLEVDVRKGDDVLAGELRRVGRAHAAGADDRDVDEVARRRLRFLLRGLCQAGTGSARRSRAGHNEIPGA